MHKYETQLTNFAFNSAHEIGVTSVVWYRLDESDDELCGIGMDLVTEIKPLEAFFLKMTDNFKVRNYEITDEEDELYISEYDQFPVDGLRRPKYLILRKGGEIEPVMSACMPIVLLAPNGTRKKLDTLPFPIIGEII